MAGVNATVRVNDGMSRALMSMNRALNTVISSFERMQAASSSSVDASDIASARAELHSAASEIQRIEDNLQDANHQQEQFTRNAKNSDSAVSGLARKVGGLLATYASFQTMLSAVKLSDQMTQTTSRLSLIVDDGGSVEELEQKIMDSANRTGSYYMDTAKTVASLAQRAGGAFKGNDEVIAFTETLNKMYTVVGANAEEQASSMLQLTQALGSGVLRGEEFNAVYEAAPNIMQAVGKYISENEELARNMAKVVGTSYEEMSTDAEPYLRKLAEEGVLSAGLVKNAVFSAAEETNGQFESMSMTWERFANLVRNRAITAFEPVLQKINEIANNPAVLEFAIGMVDSLSVAVEVILGMFERIATKLSVLANNPGIQSLTSGFMNAMATIGNVALTTFETIIQKVIEFANNPAVQTFALNIIGAVSSLGSVVIPILGTVIGMAIDIATVFIENWSYIAPIIGGIVTAIGIYKGALIAFNVVQGISNGLKAIAAFREAVHAAKLGMSTGATFAQTAAQYGLNAALLACPITWIILLIIALVAAVYGVVAAINHFAGTSLSATGLIVGYFYALYAKIANYFIMLWNVIAEFINFFANVFNDPVASVKVLFYGLASTVIGYVAEMARAIENIINKIPGVTVDITSGLDSFRGQLEKAAEDVKSESEWKEVVQKKDFLDISDYAKKGYDKGKSVDSAVSNAVTKIKEGFNVSEAGGGGGGANIPAPTSYDDLAKNTGNTAKNTGAMADAMEVTEEDLKYLRDIAEKEAINRFTTAQIKIDMKNNNTISSDMDIDGIVTQLEEKLYESMERSAEGVY